MISSVGLNSFFVALCLAIGEYTSNYIHVVRKYIAIVTRNSYLHTALDLGKK